MLGLTLVLFLAGCGGVLNPPPPPPTPTAFITSTPRPRPPTRTPVPEVWIKNHRITEMWSGPAGSSGVVSFGRTSSLFCSFRIDRPQENARIYVYNPHSDSHFWIDGLDVGPVGQLPPRRTGPKPAGVNCTETIYEQQAGPPTPTPSLAAPTPSRP